MFRYSLARLMGLIFVVAITLGVVRFLGPRGLIVAVCILFGSLLPVVFSQRRGLDPMAGVYAVACGAFGGIIGRILFGPFAARDGTLFVILGALLGGVYWVTAVSVLVSHRHGVVAESFEKPNGSRVRPSQFLILAVLTFVLGPTVTGLIFALAMMFDCVDRVAPWAQFAEVEAAGVFGGLFIAVPCFLAWLLHVAPRRQGPLPPQSQPP